MSSLLRRTGAGCVPFVFCSTLCHAAPPVQGRWEGQVQIPGAPLTLIVDLARNGASAWTGSVIIPGLGIKGAPLGDISVTESRVSFALSGAMKAGGAAPPRITVHSVREGVVLIDTGGRVVMYNDQAADLLGLERSDVDPVAGAAPRLSDLPLDPSLHGLFESGRTAHDEIHLTGSRKIGRAHV